MNIYYLLFSILLFLAREAESKVDGSWGGWSEWSGWAKGLCSGNQRVKTRPCTNPTPSVDGTYCVGDNAMQESGPVDGGYSEWSQWSTCERPCGGSIVNRTRVCDNPPAENGGASCVGNSIETKMECVMQCPDGRVDGGWSMWSEWSACPSKCTTTGGTVIRRHRQCNMPPPMNGGAPCPGPFSEEIFGCFDVCPQHGGFGEWLEWSSCSRTCGTGVQIRGRYCDNPEPRGSGTNCTGEYSSSRPCKLQDCLGAINGGWSSWQSWGSCTEKTVCFLGNRTRSRVCDSPAPLNGGDQCFGTAEEEELCPKEGCIDGRPAAPDVLPLEETDYIARECLGVTTKRIASNGLPAELVAHLDWAKQKFLGGYFAQVEEEKGAIIKYCFDPYPAMTIKEASDKVTSFRKVGAIPNFVKPTDDSTPILGFSVRVFKGTYQIKGYDFGISRAQKYIPGNNLELHNVMFTYYSEGNFWGFLAKGEFRLFAPFIFKSVVFNNQTEGVSSMIGHSPKLQLKGLVNALGIPDDLGGTAGAVVAALKGLKVWEFEFAPAEIAYDFLHEFQAAFRITATKSFGGIPLHFEVIMINSGFDRKIAFGFSFDGASFGAMIEQMSSSGSAGKVVADILNLLGFQVEVGVMWCPSFFGSFRVTRRTAFSKSPLSAMFFPDIPDGLAAVAQVGIPKDCKGSPFCEILKKILGPKAAFRLAGQVKASYYKITGAFVNVKIYENYEFSRLELYFETNTTTPSTDVGFKAEIKIPVNDGDIIVDGMRAQNFLALGGQIKHQLGSSDVSGSLYMKGMWRRAFGISWLAIGNINLGLTISAESPIVVSGFEFGGQLEFGSNCLYEADYGDNGHCLMIAVYFGCGKKSYFYGAISALTIGKLVRMCGGPTSLPKPVAEAGFPYGLEVKYNAGPSDVGLVSGRVIAVGFYLNGTLSLFGYKISALILYSTREIKIDAECDPINLGGHVVLARNATHTHVGPKLFFHFKSAKEGSLIPLPYFKMYFEGYGKFLGIEAYAYVNITMSGFEIYVYGKVWSLVYAELHIAAGYDYTNIKDAHFYVRVLVDLRVLNEVIGRIRLSVDEAFKAAQKTLNDAIQEVKEAKRKCKEQLKIRCTDCYTLKCQQAERNCKGFMDAAGRWIGGAINTVGQWIVNAGKTIVDGLASVGRKIVNFFKGWRRRRSLIDQRDEHFDIHIRNRRFVSKLICEGLVGGGCKGIEHLCYGTCKAVDFIGQGLCSILDVAVGALRLAEKACGWINAAVKFLLEMFLIHGIRFELGLGQKFNGFMVSAEIDMTLFGSRMHFGFVFDLQNPFRSIMSAKDSSMYKYKAGVKQLRTGTEYDPYDRPNPYSDFDLSGTFNIESVQTGSDTRLGACISAPTMNNDAKLVLVGCNDTDETQKWTYTLQGMLINLYSKKCLHMGPSDGDFVVQKDCNEKLNEQKTECDVVTRSLSRRRSDLCVTAAKTSALGPGSLTHLGSLMCIHVSPANRLVLKSGCARKDAEFEINNSGHLIHKSSNLCVRPVNGLAIENAQLELVSSGCHQFGFTTMGSMQHLPSRLCIQTPFNQMRPNEYTQLVLGHKCDHLKANPAASFPDYQLVFTFVPVTAELTMTRCKDFYDGSLEQRFTVMHEELNSVCSKFAHDLALHKVAAQSSVLHNGFPGRAVDGNYNFQWDKGSCTHTAEELDPWWRVDLGSEYIVTDVTIINRGDFGDRLRNFQVHVGDNLKVRLNPVCHDRVRQSHDGEAVRLQCNPPIPGRIVGVQMYGKGILSLCEVVVASRLGGMADWCRIKNGQCDQICYNQCGRKTACGCFPGYQLAYDQRTCMDIDECRSNNGGCRTDLKAFCVNYPGGFYCGCEKGYILKDNSLTECVDVNECGVQNGGCEQMCNNTLGGYMCSCRQGFERKPNDPYGCQDIDECKSNNGGCDHNCYNYHGGHWCKCREGYKLRIDGHSCEEVSCGVLEAPIWGWVEPALCAERLANIPAGTECKYSCSSGHEMDDSSNQTSLHCRVDGTWNKASPSCHPVKCPILERPENGGLVPARCHDDARGYNEFGQRCTSYCKPGYLLLGPATKYCLGDKTWSDRSNVECIKVMDPPFLNCPADMSAVLDADQSEVSLGAAWLEPQTNLEISSVTPAGVNRNYKFKYGKTVVTYSAADNDDGILTCSVLVEIHDKTPPVVMNCSPDINVTISSPYTTVSWPEPKFTDNVGIDRFFGPDVASGSSWAGGESRYIQYRAVDAAGNVASCRFHVRVKSLSCKPLIGDKYTSITVLVQGQSYSVVCGQGRTFFGPFNLKGSWARCNGGDYTMNSQVVGDRTPSCVRYTQSSKDAQCPIGSQAFSFNDWFSQRTQYYCANCPPGTAFNSTSRTCQPCPVGYYQDDEGGMSCEMCPLQTSTKEQAATNLTQCLKRCEAGQYSSSGFDEVSSPCRPCPLGTFSYFNSSTACTPCPQGSTTERPGAVDSSLCRLKASIVQLNPSSIVQLALGMSATLECFFDGYPTPTAVWSKVNGVLPSGAVVGDIFDLEMTRVGLTLTLKSVTSRDVGSYKCSVSNVAGRDEREAALVFKSSARA